MFKNRAQRVRRVRHLSPPPAGAAWPIFQRDAKLPKALPNLIGQGEVLGLARFRAKVDEQLHQTSNESIIFARRFGRRLQKYAENLGQLLEHNGSLTKVGHPRGIGFAFFQLLGVGKSVERGQQFMQDADGASRIEIVIHAIEECLTITRYFPEEFIRGGRQRAR